MVERGFREVYQLDGGILRYGERYGDAGLWRGSVYVFDGRRAVTFSEDAAVVSSCSRCGEPTARLENCADPSCRTELVLCAGHEGVRCPAHAA